MKIAGGCHCGAIAFEGEVDPSTVGVCHCTDCQRLSGSPYRAMIPVAADKFRMRGAPTIYVKTAESGRRRAQAFCPVCGSPIFAADPNDASVYSVRIGAINQRRDPPARGAADVTPSAPAPLDVVAGRRFMAPCASSFSKPERRRPISNAATAAIPPCCARCSRRIFPAPTSRPRASRTAKRRRPPPRSTLYSSPARPPGSMTATTGSSR